MKSRLYCAIVCYVLAVVLLFVCVPVVRRMTYPKTTAVHTIKPLEKGEQITKEHVAEITIGALEMPEDILLMAEESIGRYAAVDMVKGDILFQSKLSHVPMDGDVPKDILPQDQTSMLISLKMIEGSEYPLPETGDVMKLNLFDKKLRDIPELQFVRVLTVLPQEDEEAVSVTIAVNEEQKKYLVRHREDTFYASVIVRSNEELAVKLLMEQKAYFEEG